ncbi:hypothetical protein BK026_12785 [Alteromonas sp. V450]|uniref:lysoplasmalogenase n=1 Tax=Alteromonas sp. V450 TaxID=1912139 RepID=UPI0008FF1EB5|nr:lysoplasmalogenase [Alteromonas sp. V450]OJF69590.1 hypothetical protein BK026_12785 [Alteromonas sp. V450]
MPQYRSLIYAAASLIYLASLCFAPYSGQFIAKALPVGLLMLFSFLSLNGIARLMVCFALFASLIGDIFLALSISKQFIYGLTSFFIAHLAFILSFIHLRMTQPVKASQSRSARAARFALGFIVICFASLMAKHILPVTQQLYLPVLGYLCVITIMGLAAVLLTRSWWITAGALIFIVSDAILAQSIFREPIALSAFAVMLTYYTAQYLLARGLIEAYRREISTR